MTPAVQQACLDRYVGEAGLDRKDFATGCALMAAQRHARVIGVFVRLWKRDGKPRYLGLIPRVWALLERDLTHPALAPVAEWFDRNIPAELRDPAGTLGGSFAG